MITTFFTPPLRRAHDPRPLLLSSEILGGDAGAGEHLLVYGRISDVAIAALEASGLKSHVYGARDGLTEEVRRVR